MWSCIWSVVTIRIGFWTLIWSTRLCGLVQEVSCWFECWKNATGFFDQFNNIGAIDVKRISLFLRKNYLLRCWGWLSLLNWIEALTFILLLKLPSRKLEPWFVLWSFFILRLLCISINLPCSHAWNTVVMSGVKTLVASLTNYLLLSLHYIIFFSFHSQKLYKTLIHIYIYIYIYIYTYTLTHKHTQACIYVYSICICACTYIHNHIYFYYSTKRE